MNQDIKYRVVFSTGVDSFFILETNGASEHDVRCLVTTVFDLHPGIYCAEIVDTTVESADDPDFFVMKNPKFFVKPAIVQPHLKN